MLQQSGEPLKFSDVFEAAGVSRGSAYRIYIGIDDLLQDIATEWVNNFVDYLRDGELDEQPENWTTLSDYIVRRGAEYWATTADTLRVLPRVRSNAPDSYRLAVKAMSQCIADIFAQYFVVPDVPNWAHKLGFFTEICDITFADSVRTEGCISESRLSEARTLARTYLAMHLPRWLPAKQQAS